MQKVSTDKFTWHGDLKEFVAEVSDFGKEFEFEQVVADARHVPALKQRGLTLVSHKSKREADFLIEQVNRDADNDVTDWVLVPTLSAQRANPMLSGVKMVIFND